MAGVLGGRRRLVVPGHDWLLIKLVIIGQFGDGLAAAKYATTVVLLSTQSSFFTQRVEAPQAGPVPKKCTGK